MVMNFLDASTIMLGMCTWSFAGNGEISREQVAQIAKNEALRLGYLLEHLEIELDETNREWNDYVSFLQRAEVHENTKTWMQGFSVKMAGKKYLAGYFRPKQQQLGGDLFVFVDARTGDILDVVRGR